MSCWFSVWKYYELLHTKFLIEVQVSLWLQSSLSGIIVKLIIEEKMIKRNNNNLFRRFSIFMYEIGTLSIEESQVV